MEKQVKFYKRILITAGIADYKDCNDGILLIQKPVIDNALNSIKAKPVVITHDSTEPVGEVVDAYFDANSGDYICGFNLFTDEAKDLLDNKGWGVSPEYNILKSNDTGGTYHNLDYQQEAEQIDFVNLAIVEHPRYEECKKVVNSIINKGDDMALFKKVKNEVETETKENEVETKKNNVILTIDGKQIDLGQFFNQEKEEGHSAINEAEKENAPVEEEKKEEVKEENPFEARLNALEEKVNSLLKQNSCQERDEVENSLNKSNDVEEEQKDTSTKELEEKVIPNKENEVKENDVKPVQNALKKVMNSVIDKVAFKTRAERIEEVSNSFYIK